MTAEQVVKISLTGVRKGKELIVPGAFNVLTAWLFKFLPSMVVIPIMAFIMGKMVKEK